MDLVQDIIMDYIYLIGCSWIWSWSRIFSAGYSASKVIIPFSSKLKLQIINRWFIFRPTQIRYTPLLTYAKSPILHIRPSSLWFYSCYMDLWPQRPLAAALCPLACPSRSAWPRNDELSLILN